MRRSIRQAGRHLAWGYVDQPPFTPLIARIVDEVVGANLVALRLAAAGAQQSLGAACEAMAL